MSFKFDLRQRVTLPGNPSVQAIITGRGEDVHSEPLYRLAWVDGDHGVHDTAHTETDIVMANTEPQTRVVTAKVGESLTRNSKRKR